MLWFIQQEKGSSYYLTDSAEQTIGRGDSNLPLPNDQSVSRKHASIWVEDGTVKIKDLGSRYGTFINQGIETNQILTPNEVQTLQEGDKVRFGMQWNIWELKRLAIKTALSNISEEQKVLISASIKTLKGEIFENWADTCTHITVEVVYLTCKFLCGLLKGIPIVTSQYWTDCAECVKNNKILPDIKNYIPPLAEDLINKDNSNIEYNAQRQTLFAGKCLVFSDERRRAKFTKMITLAGGQVGLWSSYEKHALLGDNIIVLQPSVEINSASADGDGYCDEIKAHLEAHGKRMIPEQEIALAIWNCDLSTNCNPNFKVAGTVFERKNPVQIGDVLVPDTIPSQMETLSPMECSTQVNHGAVNSEDSIPSQTTAECSESENKSATNDINSVRKRNLDEEDVFPMANDAKRRKEEPVNSSEMKPPNSSTTSPDTIQRNPMMKTESNNAGTSNVANIVSLKRKNDNDLPDAKRLMTDRKNGLDVPKLADENILSHIYWNSGWLSKSFLKMEIKEEEEDATNNANAKNPESRLKDHVKIKKVPLVVHRNVENNSTIMNNTGSKMNFKAFKKIQPIKSGTIISSLIRTKCDGTLSRISKMDHESTIDSIQPMIRCS